MASWLAAALPLQDRLGARARIGLEAGDHGSRQRPLDQPLDVAQELVLVDADERDGLARGARATGAPDPMDVIVRHVGQVVVDDVRQLVDVDAARRDVGGDEHLQARVLEFRQRPRARALALVAVDRERRDAVVVQLLRELVRAVLRAREHEHLVPVLRLDEMREELALAVAIHGMHGLRDHVDRRVARRDLDQCRRIEQVVGERLDLVGERRREQQVLPLPGQEREDALDVADEAHVEHPVGLVEHEDLDPRQVEVALALMVEQAAGRGDEDVDAALQLRGLRADADAAEHDHRRKLRVLAVGAHALLDLRRELARRREDQRADRLPAAARRAARRRGAEASRCSIGSTKPAVLPVPVCAPASRSPPASTAGIACRWIGVGCGVAVFGHGAHERVGQPE